MSTKDQSVAPKERVNITYKPATGDATEQVELPLKILALGDFTGRDDARAIEDRKPVNVDKDSFDDVLREHQVAVDLSVPDRLTNEPGGELSVHLDIRSMKDFEPENVVRAVPELRKLLALREQLTALKGPLGNVPSFRKKLAALLESDDARTALEAELGLSPKPGE
jgi:type VI secretion system protein ImpB